MPTLDLGANAPPPQPNNQVSNKGPIAALFTLLAPVGAFLVFAESNKPFQRFIYTTFDLDPIRIGVAAVPDNIGNVSGLLRRYEELKVELKQAKIESDRGGSARHQQELQNLRGELNALLKQNEERGRLLASRDRDLQAAQGASADLERKVAGYDAQLRRAQTTGSSPPERQGATSSPISYTVEAVTIAGNV